MTTATRHKSARRTGVDWFLFFLKFAMFSVIGFGLFAFTLQQIDPNNWLAQQINDDATGLTADQFEGLVIAGLSQGSMYGLIALGYSMVYGVLGFINFAHGEVFMVGAMTGMITSNKLAEAGAWESNFVPSLLFIVVLAILVSTFTAVVMERVAYRPLRGAPRLIPLITSIGISFFIQNVSVVLLGPGAKSYPDLPSWWTETQSIWFLDVQRTRLLVVLVAGVS
ncbi:MAG: branched-chain amino acid ABC transporter permease, partial [Acidimicrobiaceae bacterium]|nr:branched-chain amino acid ABC transporter permease [Acidimicrobiaceae bacterium]